MDTENHTLFAKDVDNAVRAKNDPFRRFL